MFAAGLVAAVVLIAIGFTGGTAVKQYLDWPQWPRKKR